MKRIISTLVVIFLVITPVFADDLEVIVVEADEGMSNGAIDLTITGGTAPFAYNWTGPGGFESTAEDLTDLAAGVYVVTVTDSWCGVATLEVIVEENEVDDPNVGLADEDNFPFSIYPNPTSGLLYLTSDSPLDVAVYTILGEQILSVNNTTQIDLTGYPVGVYMIRATSEVGVATRKITLK